MTAAVVGPRYPRQGEETQAGRVRSPAEIRTVILSAWASGPGIVVVTGTPGSGRTALLEHLAASLGQTGQVVHFARRGDHAVLPAGAAILLVDAAERMPDRLLRRLFEHPGLFCVLAGRPGFADRLRSIGLTAPIVSLEEDPAADPPPLVLWLRRQPMAAVAIALCALAVVASAWVLLRPVAAPAPPPRLATVAPSSPPLQAPASAPIAEPPAPTAPAPTAPPVTATAPSEPSDTPPSDTPPATTPETVTATDELPTATTPSVGLSYVAGDAVAALLAREATDRLRHAGIASGDPVAAARTDRSMIRYYFAQDREIAEAMRSRAGDPLAGLPVELARPGPSTRPGQIDIILGDGRSGSPAPGYDTIVRARRVSGAEGR